jgi:hypothetical protein
VSSHLLFFNLLINYLQIDAFLLDFPDAYNRASALDTKIMTEASAVSPEYVDLVSLGLRQTMGSMEFTTGNAKNNPLDIKIFMKDVGISGYVFIYFCSNYIFNSTVSPAA